MRGRGSGEEQEEVVDPQRQKNFVLENAVQGSIVRALQHATLPLENALVALGVQARALGYSRNSLEQPVVR